MKQRAYLEGLKRKHKDLSRQVEAEQAAVTVDNVKMTALKKKKLRLKEEIQRLSALDAQDF